MWLRVDVELLLHSPFLCQVVGPALVTVPASVQPVHSDFLLWPRSLVWLEEDLFTECCNLLIEWFASDALVSCHTVIVNMECRQCRSCLSHKPLQE